MHYTQPEVSSVGRNEGKVNFKIREEAPVGQLVIETIARPGRQAITAVDALITARRVIHYPVFMLIIGATFYLASIAAGHPPFDAYGHPLAIDLSNRVTAGRLVLNGEVKNLYNVERQWKVQQGILGGGHPEFLDVYISPPFVAYVYAPLAALPYELAAALWIIVTVALLIWDLHLLLPLVPNVRRHGFLTVLVVMLSTWPVMELITDGQDAAVSLLILVGGIRLLRLRRDVLAGILLGLGIFKPQLFLLIPVFLLLQKRWNALAGWCAVSAALTLTSIVIIGLDGVQLYLALLTSSTLHQAISTSLGWKMQSLLALTSALFAGPSSFLITPITLGIDVVLVVRFVQVALRTGPTAERLIQLYAVTVLTGSIISPYFFMYDCVILLLPSLILLDHAPRDVGVRLPLAAAYILTWTAPLRYLGFGHLPWPVPLFAAPWTVLPLVFLAWSTCRSIDQADRLATGSVS